MKKGLIYIIIAGVMWGSCSLFVDVLAPYGFSSLQMVAMRISISAVAMLLFCLLFKRGSLKTPLKYLPLYMVCGLSLFGTAYFYYVAMRLTSPGTAVVLMYVSPVPIMLLSVLLYKEKFNLLKGVGVLLMLVGCVFVAGIIGDFKPDATGVVYGFLSAAAYTVYNIFCKLEAKLKIDSVTSTFYTFIFGGIFALLLCSPGEIPALIAKEPLVTVPTLLGQSLVTCFFPYLLYSLALKRLSVGVAASLSILEPMTGAVVGLCTGKEHLNALIVIGMVLVLGSVLLLGLSENEKKPKTA